MNKALIEHWKNKEVEAIKKQAQQYAEEMASLENKIKEAQYMLEEYRKKVEQVSKTRLGLNTDRLRREFYEIYGYLDSIKKRYAEPMEFNVVFKGTGSDKKLITEKIHEVDGKIKDLEQNVSVGVDVKESVDSGETDQEGMDEQKVSKVSVDFRATEMGRSPSTFREKVSMVKDVADTVVGVTKATSAMFKVIFLGGKYGEKSVIEEGKSVISDLKRTKDDIEKIIPAVRTIFTGEDGSELSE